MSVDLTMRLSELGAILAARMPIVLAAVVALLESVARALDAERPERYEIQHRIGAGGQAEVFLGAVRGAEGFERPVAVKRVRADAPDAGRSATTLIEEARLAAGLSHPNVVSVLDFDRDRAGQLYLVMEHIDGVNLAQLIETGPVPHPAAIFIVRELLSGLGYIHELEGEGRVRGLVHRDVAPDNVLLSRSGVVKLADFGVARALVVTMTAASGKPVGKPGYMSPEQANGDELDGRSDLYAVGIVLWELLASRRLRVGAAGDIAVQAVFQAIPRPSEYRQGVPGDLEAVAMRLLAPDRAERYQTAELAAHDLASCQDTPRDGRGELVRLLAERFPRPRRRRPGSRPPEPGWASNGPITVADTAVPAGASPEPGQGPGLGPELVEQGSGRGRAGALERAWRWRWALVVGVVFALVLAAVIMLLVVR